MPLTIRSAEPADLPGLRALYRHLNPTDDPPPEDETLRQVWNTMLAQPGFGCIVGVDAEILVSSCCLAIIPNLTRGCRPYGLIENVVTHQGYRRRGFGRAVVGEALGRAWSAGCYKVMLLSGSKDADGLYRSCGFRSDEKMGFVARPV